MENLIAYLNLLVTSRFEGLATRLEAEEDGQTAAEYVGIIVIVAIIIGAIATTDIGGQIASGISSQIERILGSG